MTLYPSRVSSAFCIYVIYIYIPICHLRRPFGRSVVSSFPLALLFLFITLHFILICCRDQFSYINIFFFLLLTGKKRSSFVELLSSPVLAPYTLKTFVSSLSCRTQDSHSRRTMNSRECQSLKCNYIKKQCAKKRYAHFFVH